MSRDKRQKLAERMHLPLHGGRALPLPLSFEPRKFLLPRNSKELLPDLMYAVYDEETKTGAIWRALPEPFWVFVQPCTREAFFGGMCDEALATYLKWSA